MRNKESLVELKYVWNLHDKVFLHSASNINFQRVSGGYKDVQEINNALLKVEGEIPFPCFFAYK